MKRGVKHENQFQIVHADFSGGLNTSANVDGIADNQLAHAVNVEIDHATGKLKTVAGTVDVLMFTKIFAAAYDEINKKILLVDEEKKVYAYDLDANTISNALGILSGELYPICASWEDGLLIASDGKLQYFDGTQLITLDSPTATSVCVQAGRILITDEKNLYLSGVGDATATPAVSSKLLAVSDTPANLTANSYQLPRRRTSAAGQIPHSVKRRSPRTRNVRPACADLYKPARQSKRRRRREQFAGEFDK